MHIESLCFLDHFICLFLFLVWKTNVLLSWACDVVLKLGLVVFDLACQNTESNICPVKFILSKCLWRHRPNISNIYMTLFWKERKSAMYNVNQKWSGLALNPHVLLLKSFIVRLLKCVSVVFHHKEPEVSSLVCSLVVQSLLRKVYSCIHIKTQPLDGAL